MTGPFNFSAFSDAAKAYYLRLIRPRGCFIKVGDSGSNIRTMNNTLTMSYEVELNLSDTEGNECRPIVSSLDSSGELESATRISIGWTKTHLILARWCSVIHFKTFKNVKRTPLRRPLLLINRPFLGSVEYSLYYIVH